MKPISCNQEMGDTERLLFPGAPQGPARVSRSEFIMCEGTREIKKEKGDLGSACM